MTPPRGSTAPLTLPLGTIAAAAVTAVVTDRTADLVRLADRHTVDTLVALAAGVIGVGVGAWLTGSLLLATSCLAARLMGRSWRRGERAVQRWAPRAVRRALVSAMAAGMGLGLGGVAQAATVDPATVDLGWTVTTARTPDTGATSPTHAVSAANEVRGAGPAVPKTSVAGDDHVVGPGDTLWSIAAEHLAPDADDVTIAREWPAWYAANVGTIGSDPNLLRPGQVLHPPQPISSDARVTSEGVS
jgi:LysM repeat protein